MRRALFAAAVGIVVVVMVAAAAEGVANTGWIWEVCNSEKITAGSLYFESVGQALEDVLQNTAANGFGYYYRTTKGGTNGTPTAFAAGRCSEHLSPFECRDCLRVITDGIWNACANAIGAQEKLVDCYVRYEQYNFE